MYFMLTLKPNLLYFLHQIFDVGLLKPFFFWTCVGIPFFNHEKSAFMYVYHNKYPWRRKIPYPFFRYVTHLNICKYFVNGILISKFFFWFYPSKYWIMKYLKGFTLFCGKLKSYMYCIMYTYKLFIEWKQF